MTVDTLSLPEARRIALASLGLARPRPSSRIDIRHLRAVVHQLSLVQIDYVNVLIPAHFLVPFTRLGPYDVRRFHDLIYQRNEFTEQWAHEASIIPMRTWPLLRHRMPPHPPRPRWIKDYMRRNRAYVDRVLAEIETRGPLAASDLPTPADRPAKLNGTWIGTIQRAILEDLFSEGTLASADRYANFVRAYDLAENRIPTEHFQRQVDKTDAQRELLLQAAESYGVATAADLADYFRMSIRDARSRLAELVEAAALREVRVESWTETAYLHPKAKLPRCSDAAALVSPFDPLIWFRPRAARLFDFEYRIEIYVPAAKRRWGYYVLPFLLGDRLVARVDLKAHRQQSTLSVIAAYVEPHADPQEVAQALAAELRTLARWLGLENVTVGRRGNLARHLRTAAALRG